MLLCIDALRDFQSRCSLEIDEPETSKVNQSILEPRRKGQILRINVAKYIVQLLLVDEPVWVVGRLQRETSLYQRGC